MANSELKRYEAIFKNSGVEGRSDYANHLLENKLNGKNVYSLNKKPNIFAFYPDEVWVRDAFEASLNRLGSTFHYLYNKKFDQQASDWYPAKRQEMNEDLWRTIQTEHAKRPIDVFFSYASGWLLTGKLIKKINSLGIVTVNYGMNENGFEGVKLGEDYASQATIAPHFDLNAYVGNRIHEVKYLAVGGAPYYWPEGANPEIYKPIALKKEIDVLFVGHQWSTRIWAINYLRKRGINVLVYGREWPNGPLPVEKVNEYYNKSRIVLGVGGHTYSKISDLKARDFEVPMSGAFYLTQTNSDFSELGLYNVGKEIVCFDGHRDLEAKIRYFLSHSEQREAIAQAGCKRARSEHTWDHRFKELFEKIKVI